MATAKDAADARATRVSRLLAQDLGRSVARRDEIPIRTSFLRNDDPEIVPPLARLASTGGRGAGVSIKLFQALIWRCSSPPFDTDISSRKWATLLDLDDPNTAGARRVTSALSTLDDHGLVSLERRRGEATVVKLLNEAGSGAPYSLPSTAYTLARDDDARAANRYFKVPTRLWTDGYMQRLSPAAVSMLLILIAERNVDNRPTWWSTTRFPALFNISPAVRTKGTAELVDRGLLSVVKTSVTDGQSKHSFGRERVRNTYRLLGAARPASMIASQEAARKKKRRVLLVPATKKA